MKRWRKLGIIAGGGALPLRLAAACQAMGEPAFVIRLKGHADPALEAHEGASCGLAEVGKIVRLLKKAGCDAIVMAGVVRRPNFAALTPDWRGAALLPKVVAAGRRGDGAMLDVLVETFEAEGFFVIGAEEVSTTLAASHGALGARTPGEADLEDIAKAAALVAALGPFDVGQGAVVRAGFVLAIEAAEGTDAMLERVASLPAEMRGYEPGEETVPRGVLVKRPKPGQELRVDLPTIGTQTVMRVKAAGLAGIAVEAGAALVIDGTAVAEAANEAGIFVYGFTASDF